MASGRDPNAPDSLPNTEPNIRPVSFRQCRCRCLKHVTHPHHYSHTETCRYLKPPEDCTVFGLRRCDCSTCDCLCSIHFIERAQLVTHTDHFETKTDSPPPEDASATTSGLPSLKSLEDEFLAALAQESRTGTWSSHPLLEFIRSAPHPILTPRMRTGIAPSVPFLTL